ncbi:MAG: hypothetical protein CBD08_003970 [Cellvibrionales bacterium TMED148]|nr:MAG: hypothetical protein CBD08_003970 [Cellvibrionales bacterium TMED148]
MFFDVCPECHHLRTGNRKMLDPRGRVGRLNSGRNL